MNNSHYDVERMKSCASRMEDALRKFREAEKNVNDTVSHLASVWDDDTFRRYTGIYNSSVREELKEAGDVLEQYAELMKAAAKKYGNAIDSGNAHLSV